MVSALALPAGVYAQHAPAPHRQGQHLPARHSRAVDANPLKDSLRILGLHGSPARQIIPPDYLLGSAEQRLALLQGLLDTDGHAGVVVEYVSVSKRLARGVVELVQSLGGTARIRLEKDQSYVSGRTPHRVGLARDPEIASPSLIPFACRRSCGLPPSKQVSAQPGHQAHRLCGPQGSAVHRGGGRRSPVRHRGLYRDPQHGSDPRPPPHREGGGPRRPPQPGRRAHQRAGQLASEAARFAPRLNVLTLHGPKRRAEFDRIPDVDLILTTYPLLAPRRRSF